MSDKPLDQDRIARILGSEYRSLRDEDLFTIAEVNTYHDLKKAGAHPCWNPTAGYWRLPDGSVVVEAEAIAWLRGVQDRSGSTREPTNDSGAT